MDCFFIATVGVVKSEAEVVMANAQEDLAGNIDGHFSPDDWRTILARAKEKLERSPLPAAEAWVEVIREFHRERYWGFIPNYKKPSVTPEAEENLGKKFILYTFRSFLISETVVLYCGARYSADDHNPIYKWGFFAGLTFLVVNYGLFLYRYGGRSEE